MKQPSQQHSKQQEKIVINHQIDFSSLKDFQKNINEKRAQKQNFQSIFDNIITLLKELKNRQQQIQSYVQKEIVDMNQKLDYASKQLLQAIQQFQSGENEVNLLESTQNGSKQNFSIQYSQNPTNNKEIIHTKQQQNCRPISSSSSKFETNKNVIENSQIKQASPNLIKSNLMKVSSKAKDGNPFQQIKNINKLTQNIFSQKSQDKSAQGGVPYNYFNQQKAKNTTNQNKTNITEENQDNSLLNTQYANQSSCNYCGKDFQSEFISTPCYHNYHDPCLREHYNFQLENYTTQKQLVCMCKMKLPQLFLIRSLKVDLEGLFQKQIQIIREKLTNQIDWCVKCKFFWIKSMSDTQTRQCKMCDQNGIIFIKFK